MIQEDALESPRGEIIGRGRKPTVPGTGVLLSAEQTVASCSVPVAHLPERDDNLT